MHFNWLKDKVFEGAFPFCLAILRLKCGFYSKSGEILQ